MATSYTWPVSLPQSPQKGYTESGGVLLVRTPQDSGPAKQRRRGNKPQVLSVMFLMTTSQLTTLEGFVKTTLRGVYRFNFPHPRLGTSVEARIIPQGDGDLYQMSYAAPGYYQVSMQLEILP